MKEIDIMDMKDHKELLEIARRVVWFAPPEKVIKDKRLFLTYLMTYGTDEDTNIQEEVCSILEGGTEALESRYQNLAQSL